ncbi:MAG: NADH-ubiquinone oxidoreductase-F iron-sulfur binding region domain-containing protein [Acidimicrobiales bacterium]
MTPVATSPPMPVRWRRARPPNSEPAGVEMMLVGEPGPTRLLAHLPPAGEWRSLAEHRTVYSMPPAPRSKPNQRLIDLVGRAGLRGRGGGGFPTARKLQAVADGARRGVVVANATEGEPASAKDRLLVSRLPHLVLDGALLAAHAVGAEEVIVCVDRTRLGAAAAMNRAVLERLEREPMACPVRVALTPPRYVAGEETALVNWLNGGPSKPTSSPPRPSERGVDRRPTLVQNVETLAHLAQIAASGADWFRQAGTTDEPGTALFTVSGAAGASVLEAALGTTGGALLRHGGVLPGGDVQAVLVGGFFGTWMVGSDFVRTPLSRSALAPFGASPGAGIVVALPPSACGLLETARILAWYAGESAGQCGPCAFGLPALAGVVAQLAAGRAQPDDVTRMQRWADDIDGRGGCRHPDGAVRLLRSALAVFGADVDTHLSGHPCPGSGRPTLAIPVSTGEWK